MSGEQDPIADLLTRIRNALASRKVYIDVGFSKIKESIVKILKSEGFIAYYLVKEENKKGCIRVFLKYNQKMEPLLHGLKRISKPSRRIYMKCCEIPRPRNGLGVVIVSTNRGILTGAAAAQEHVGGEPVCIVW